MSQDARSETGPTMKRHFFPQLSNGGDSDDKTECLVLNGNDAADRHWIQVEGGFDEAATEILAKPPKHNRRVHLGSLIVLSFVRSQDARDDDSLIGVKIMVEVGRLVAVCYGTEDLVNEALTRHAQHHGHGGASRLLTTIVTALVRPLEAEITRLVDTIDALEDKAMAESSDAMSDDVVLVGRQMLGLRRYLLPMRDELSFLAYYPEELPGSGESRYLRRTAEYLARLVSALDASHQRVTLVLSQLRNRDESRLARSMHKLTLVATVFLPLSFVTGLLGVNVAGIPDAHDPLAFWLVCIFLLLIAILCLVLLKWRKWM